MRISEKEWENIDFRKKKYRQLKAALDEAVTGRDNKVSAFVLCEDGRYSTEALDRLVDELIKSMDEYGNRHNMWLKALGDENEAGMPEKFREFVSDYLYCIIRLMISNMDWVEKVLTWPFEDSFQQILSHAVEVRRLAIKSDVAKFCELWGESYYCGRGDGSLFDIFTLAYESLKDVDISTTLTPEMRSMVEKLCGEQNAAYEEYLKEAEEDVMSDVEIDAALSELDEDEEYNQYMDEMLERTENSENEFKRTFIDAEVYCQRYIRLREIFYMELDGDEMKHAMAEFDDLVEGMIDVFMCRRGMSLYVDVKEFVRSYTCIKKQIDRIKELRWEV